MEEKQKSVDHIMLDRMKEMKVETMYDRYRAATSSVRLW